ncbi:MAG: YggS family pyridoxal phosphate-dependent enzyme [Aquabacterium sp.]|jgi:pyridoxal phosphate enzyme (YggS family)|uniref:YggS family pyridoxal phosphate-dependent enzyme n=1 Tax=Aquabacterium sp. TaxID=1872578 RepID=UPI002A35A21F|nr:YggS family pyridoxal phosphate-dependent enzyme [Aquabacterium sp.]MDX9842585.1 YggS family pyridoxal phosphate-dependent enzyme [Aquabacterium sp.]
MATIANNLQLVRNRIQAACAQTGRPADSVTLLAVSKTFPAVTVRDAFHAGQRWFGENYVQEALDKIAELADLREQITWHLIGPLQSNKTRVVAEHFDWVQSVDRLKIAQRLSEQRPAHLPPLQVCIQVNTSGEESKSGVAPGEALALAQAVAALPRLQLRGVMALPAPSPDPAVQAEALAQVRVVFEQLRAAGLALDVLSMGMSGDLEAAVAQGSTMVRVGTALFGQR